MEEHRINPDGCIEGFGELDEDEGDLMKFLAAIYAC